MAPQKGKKTEDEKVRPIIIKRIKKVAGGHHGGAWKVAYADFVTAMMAFFLLLWLLNVTTQEQKNAISNYFDPSHPKISDVTSGAGGILGGTTMSPEGAMASMVQPLVQPDKAPASTRGEHAGDTKPGDASEEEMASMLRKKEDERFKEAEEKLKAQIAASPELKAFANNVLVDITPEGLRIQIVDDKGRSMFPSGSAVMYDFMRKLLTQVTGIVKPLPNQISVRGHTDSAKYRDPKAYDNWNLSADRAQASRRVMIEGGLVESRIDNVMGRSDRDPLDVKDPSGPRNRRISIILLRENAKPAAKPATPPAAAKTPSPSKGLEIIDDTQPAPGADKGAASQGNATTAPATNAAGSQQGSSSSINNFGQPVDSGLPLPTTDAPASGIKSQPKVIYFGDTPAPEKSDDSLYQGPVQSPYVNKPPTIKTPVFRLKENKAAPAPTPAPAPAAAVKAVVTEPASPPSVEAPAATTPAVTTPPASTTGDVQLINPKLSPKVLEFGAVPPAAAPAPVQQSAPATTDRKTVTFD